MTLERAVEWVKAHRWWVVLVLLVVVGYSVGKDQALRDNAAGRQLEAGA